MSNGNVQKITQNLAELSKLAPQFLKDHYGAKDNAFHKKEAEFAEYQNEESLNAILKNNAHGGPENIMIRLPGTNGDAIHQGNNASIQDTAYTDGCIGVTAVSSNLVDGETEVEINYKAFKNAINPYGYQGVRVNVEIK